MTVPLRLAGLALFRDRRRTVLRQELAERIMPQPRISIQPVWEQVPQPAPLQKTHDMSTSAEGSVKGKKLGRMRIFESAPKRRLMKCSSSRRRRGA